MKLTIEFDTELFGPQPRTDLEDEYIVTFKRTGSSWYPKPKKVAEIIRAVLLDEEDKPEGSRRTIRNLTQINEYTWSVVVTKYHSG